MEDNDELYLDDDDDEILEGYCVRDRRMVEIEDPQPVWTRRGMPATRGECPDCGGTVFRMGRTAAHDRLQRPDAVQVSGTTRTKLARDTAYIVYALPDELMARTLADDLERIGIASWLHDYTPADVEWAGGVHPALSECQSLIVVLSPSAVQSDDVETAWRFFKDKRKPVVIAQIDRADPPDPIRRSPRFDFKADYKTAFRQLVQAL